LVIGLDQRKAFLGTNVSSFPGILALPART
jgi:hypothetical protein